MLRMVLGATAFAIASIAWPLPGAADGSLSSVSDLDHGADNWQYIAPKAGAAAPGASITGVTTTHPAAERSPAAAKAETPIGDFLSVEAAPPPPRKPAPGPLWFARQNGH
jgi:hypothetical protein